MFANNKAEGSKGPWLSWSSNGSAEKGFPPRSWTLHEKNEQGERSQRVVEGFAAPCVFDVDTLKLGWEKDTAQGPERHYSSHFSVAMARPDESKKQNGAYAWTNCLQVRVALARDLAATWEQGSYGAYQAWVDLSRKIEAEWGQSQNGKLLPVVQMTGTRQEALKSGSTNIPILEIVKWVERPAILTDAAPTIANNVTPAPVSAPAPAPAPAAPVAATQGGF